jgi:hypothetical protein
MLDKVTDVLDSRVAGPVTTVPAGTPAAGH